MKGAIVKNGKVINTIKLPPDWKGKDWNGETCVVSEAAKVGDSYTGDDFVSPDNSKSESKDPSNIDILIEALNISAEDWEAARERLLKG